MKKTFLFLGVLSLSSLSYADTKNVCISVKEMECAMCAAKVEAAVKKVEGVTKCSVDHKTSKGSIDYDDTKTNADKILEICNRTGFKCEKCEEGK